MTYEVESVAGGYLSVGKLTAKLEKANKKLPSPACGRGGGGEGGLNQNDRLQSAAPLFAVRTPTAVVTDLGTEFGIEVSDEGVTDTQVFVGKVQVAPIAPQGNGKSELLRAGQAAQVGKNRVVCLLREHDRDNRTKRFVRIMPNAQSGERFLCTNRAFDESRRLLSNEPMAND